MVLCALRWLLLQLREGALSPLPLFHQHSVTARQLMNVALWMRKYIPAVPVQPQKESSHKGSSGYKALRPVFWKKSSSTSGAGSSSGAPGGKQRRTDTSLGFSGGETPTKGGRLQPVVPLLLGADFLTEVLTSWREGLLAPLRPVPSAPLSPGSEVAASGGMLGGSHTQHLDAETVSLLRECLVIGSALTQSDNLRNEPALMELSKVGMRLMLSSLHATNICECYFTSPSQRNAIGVTSQPLKIKYLRVPLFWQTNFSLTTTGCSCCVRSCNPIAEKM